METTVKQRLIAYLDYKGISKSEFGRRVGVSSAFVSSIRSSISKDTIQSITLKFPDLNRDWLLYGEGEMLKPSGASITNVQTSGRDSVFNGATGAEQASVLKTEIEYLKKILEEKERTIQLLMKAAGNNL